MHKKEETAEHQHIVWKKESDELTMGCRIFDVRTTRMHSPEGRSHNYYYLDSPDWANVIAVTKDKDDQDCFVMVRQFRQGLQQITLEFPGGVVDDGEKPEAAARRELAEETGYQADRMLPAGTICPNPAIMNNWAYTFIAEDVHPAQSQDLDDNELVDVELWPVPYVIEHMGTGVFVNAIMMVALDWYRRYTNYA
ncbi:MAG: NUDIX hydrolase [Spirochaetales bacterium]|nr:NUDIX hydrolase [Spirochaetales bacterium]MCF7938575.1 NUDIX hydrolase [Spirochaetales bacterium]